MSKSSDAANAMMYTVEKTCELYGVKSVRQQSRCVMVTGSAGRWRPMYFGQWKDDFGKHHRSGMADVLARPKISRDAAPWTILVHDSKDENSLADVMMGGVVIVPSVNKEVGTAMVARQRERMKDDRITVPLWIECKTGKGRMSTDQIQFKNYVEGNGEHFLLLHDDMRPLIEWFDKMGVKR